MSAARRRLQVQAGVLVALTAALTIGSILSITLDRTLLSVDFYLNGIDVAGVPETLSTSFVPSATRSRLRHHYPSASDAVLDAASELATSIFTAAWFGTQSRAVGNALLPVLAGETEAVALRVPVADRLRAVEGSLRTRLPGSPLASVAYRRLTGRVASEVAKRRLDSVRPGLPFGLTADRDAWLEAIRLAAPQPWITASLERQLGHTVAYLTGDSETLAIRIPLQERQASISQAISFLVSRSNVNTWLLEHVVRPALHHKLQDRVLVPEAKITLTRNEMGDTLGDLLQTKWVEARRADIVQVGADWLVGRSDSLDLTIPLEPLKKLAIERLTGVVTGKVKTYLKGMPACTRSQVGAILTGKGDPLACRTTGLASAAFDTLLGARVRKDVRAVVVARVPERYTVTTAEVKGRASQRSWALAQRGRGWMREGVRIDSERVRGLLHDDRRQLADEVRVVTTSGWLFTDHHLTGHLQRAQPQAAVRLEAFRDLLRTARLLRVPVHVGLVLSVGAFALLVGFIGRIRLLLALGALALGGVISLLGIGLVDLLVSDPLAALSARIAASVEPTIAGALGRAAPVMLDVLWSGVRHEALRLAGTVTGISLVAMLAVWWVSRAAPPEPDSGLGEQVDGEADEPEDHQPEDDGDVAEQSSL